MSEHTKRISTSVPQLVGENNPQPLQSHVSILKDLDPTTRLSSASSRRRALLIPMLALSAVAGGVAASLVAGVFSTTTHPVDNVSTASSSTASSSTASSSTASSSTASSSTASPETAAAELKQAEHAARDRPLEFVAPSVKSAAAIILEVPQLQTVPSVQSLASQDAERLPSSRLAAAVAVAKPPSQRPGSGAKRRASKPARHASVAHSKPGKDEVVDKAAAERDVDIITAIVKDVPKR
ncbi:hypothetical protein O4G98_11895 [Zoogloeaceae bacterium G21618-S1]|nr:hypothetical protein [Zoogloeaceae bacterium G21618-S1]